MVPDMRPKSKNLPKGSYESPKTLLPHFVLHVGKTSRSESEHKCKQTLFSHDSVCWGHKNRLCGKGCWSSNPGPATSQLCGLGQVP